VWGSGSGALYAAWRAGLLLWESCSHAETPYTLPVDPRYRQLDANEAPQLPDPSTRARLHDDAKGITCPYWGGEAGGEGQDTPGGDATAVTRAACPPFHGGTPPHSALGLF